MELVIDFLSNKSVWHILKYPFYQDAAFLFPFIPYLIFYLVRDTKNILRFTLKGFFIYSSVLFIFGIISYFFSHSSEYFSLGEFVKRFIKLIVLYPICRSLLYLFTKHPSKANNVLNIYVYALLGSIVASTLR